MDTTLLTLGVILILLGLIGQVKAKEIEVGTKNGLVRLILGLVGVLFVAIALKVPPISKLFAPADTSTPPPAMTVVPPATQVPPT